MDKLEDIKQKLIQTGLKPEPGEWGRLMIRKPDGHPVYLTCVYTGGFDEVIRSYPNAVKFALTFHAEDPLFHDDSEAHSFMQDLGDMLYFKPEPLLYMHPDLYMRGPTSPTIGTVTIDGQDVYPEIIITGPAENIGIVNRTTGKQIVLSADVTLTAGEDITIITEKLKGRSITKTAIDGTKTSLLNKLTSSSSLNFTLRRGQNRIEFSNTAIDVRSSLRFLYHEGYLSAE